MEDQIAFADGASINKTAPLPLQNWPPSRRPCAPSTRTLSSTAPSAPNPADCAGIAAHSTQARSDNDPHFLDHDHPDHVCGPGTAITITMIMTIMDTITMHDLRLNHHQ